MAWAPPSKPGDRHPSIIDAKRKLRGYSYGKGLDSSDEYTVGFGAALIQFQQNRNAQILKGQVRDMPGMNIQGILDWASKKNLKILPEQLNPPAARKLVLAIPGHLGSMFDGPQFFTARTLEEQGRVRVQPVGYNNGPIPFDNRSGVIECDRLVNDPRVLPPGTEWAITSHSQGSIVDCLFYRDIIAPNQNRWPYSHYRGGVRFGNPMRPMNTVAPWIADPPPRGSEGLSNQCLTEPTPGVAEASRDGDLYANKTPGPDAEYKVAVFRAVQGEFFGADTITEQLMEIAMSFGNPVEVFAIFQAIVSGVVGLINLREHGEFDLRPCVDHLARVLAV